MTVPHPPSSSSWSLPETYDFRGREVRYGVRGSGPPLVAVHGTPWSSYNLRHIIAGLAGEFTVYYYDLLGYGLSSMEEGDVSLGVQNELLASLLAHWKLTAPAVVAHDFGGMTVLRAHLLDDRDFKKIVLIDPVAISPWGSPFFRHVREHEEAFAGVPDYIHDAIVRAYVRTAAFRPLHDDLLAAIVRPWTGSAGKKAFYRQIAQADAVYTDEVQPMYRQISRPVLILWGEQDTWIPVEYGQQLRDLIPGATLRVLPNAGHLVIEEEPAQLVAAIRHFLQ